MPDRLAIIGFPFSGKTAVLQAVCELSAEHLHTVGELGEHIGTFRHTADPRLQGLAAFHASKKITPMSFELWDYPGLDLSTEASRQHVRRLLAQVRQHEVLVIVLRAFENPSVPAYRDRVDPAADLDELMTEFVFADMDQLTRRIEKLDQQLTKPTADRDHYKRELDLVQRCLSALEAGQGLDHAVHTADETKMLSSFALLTQRPCVVIINTDEDRLDKAIELTPHPAVKAALTVAADFERQLQELPEEDRQPFLAEAGITERMGERLVPAALAALGTIVFYTAADNEARAWPVPAGITVVQAAGKIHTDMARGFIRAETIGYDQLLACGSAKQARAEGKLRLEGKDYIVQDGEVILFRFNV